MSVNKELLKHYGILARKICLSYLLFELMTLNGKRNMTQTILCFTLHLAMNNSEVVLVNQSYFQYVLWGKRQRFQNGHYIGSRYSNKASMLRVGIPTTD